MKASGLGTPAGSPASRPGGTLRHSRSSDRAFELAILIEHLSAWSDARLDSGAFVALFELTAAERARLAQFRRLAALFWLLHLRPGGRASRRNPPGTLRRQAERLLALLG